VNALKRSRKEIEFLEECIINEHKILKAAFERELGKVENAFKSERKELLETKQNELEALVMERDTVEVEGLKLQRDDVDTKRQEIKQAQRDENNASLVTREKLESELRRLEIALEDTRARQDLDTDKLEYDVRVLTELREDETVVTKLKKRIMMGKGALYDSLDIKQRDKKIEMKENNRLERDCERIEKQAAGMK
jgi:multidrug efflux pump subunit AcrA (membrane-fusion protein)